MLGLHLAKKEVNVLLQNPLFILPVICNWIKQEYILILNSRKVTPLTFCFNIVPTFEPSIMVVYLQQKLIS